jgi:hypothetical protein
VQTFRVVLHHLQVYILSRMANSRAALALIIYMCQHIALVV